MSLPALHETSIRVRYAETDQMGVVHHSNYLVYFETGRTEQLRASGLDYRSLEANGHYLVVARLSCKFRRPARYDDVLTLRTSVKRLTRARIDHGYELMRGAELLVEGESTLACVDADGSLRPIPAVLLEGAG